MYVIFNSCIADFFDVKVLSVQNFDITLQPQTRDKRPLRCKRNLKTPL